MLLLFFLALISFQPISAASEGSLFEKARSLQTLNTANDDDPNINQPGNPLRYILYYANLYGKWSESAPISQGNYFTQSSGYVVVETHSDDDLDATDTLTDTDTDSSEDEFSISDSDILDYTVDDFLLVIFDGMATNKNSIQLNINFANLTYFPANSSFIGTQEIDYVLGGVQNGSITNCPAYIQIIFTNLSNSDPSTSAPHVPLSETGVQFIVTSSNCSISLTTDVMTIVSFAEKALPVYLILMSFAGLIGAYSAYHMLKRFPENVEELKSMSVWSLWITSAWELFLALFHIYVAVKYFQFWVLVVTFIFFFTLSMLRKINQLILIVSRVERGDTLPLNNRMLLALVPMCILSITYLVAAFVPKVSFLVLTAGLYMAPQVYRIYKKGQRPRGYYWHNFAFVFSKVFFVAYYQLYPENLFEATPNFVVGWLFVGLIILQMFIIMLQRNLPQCLFTFRRFINKKQGIMADKNEECAICFETLSYDVEKGSNDQVCETPCHHKFHRRCIEEWLNLRGNCPLDRNVIDLGDLLF